MRSDQPKVVAYSIWTNTGSLSLIDGRSWSLSMKENVSDRNMSIATSNSPSSVVNWRVLLVGEIGPDETMYLSS